MSILGNKNVDYEILHKLSDRDLVSICKIDKYYRTLCSDDIFWMNRTLKRFSFILGDIKTIKKYKKNQTWKLIIFILSIY
jgi:hypothetical protein